MNSFTDKKLLVITDYFPNQNGSVPMGVFVKSQVDALKKYFKKIIVISPTPYAPKVLRHLPFASSFQKNTTYLKSYSYENVEVHFPTFYTLPLKYFRSKNPDIAYNAVRKYVKKHNLAYDMIHAHFTLTSGYIAHKLTNDTPIKYVLTIHENSDWFKQEVNSDDKRIMQTWKDAAALLRVNQQDLSTLQKFNSSTHQILNGYDETLFDSLNKNVCREKLSIPVDAHVVLHVGFYKQWQKNQLTLIRAIARLHQQGEDIVCYLIGGGPDQNLFEKEIKKHNLQNVVYLLGSKPHTQIPLWMNAADIFVFPSFSESFGVVAIEALACGTPVITTINGGTEEIITDEKVGHILPTHKNEKIIAKYIQQALNTTWNSIYIQKFAQKYSWSSITKKLVEIYEEVL